MAFKLGNAVNFNMTTEAAVTSKAVYEYMYLYATDIQEIVKLLHIYFCYQYYFVN